MRPTEILRNEHRVIEQVLDCLDAMVVECERTGRIAEEPARQAIDFFRTFADHCHHGKEENQLFPLLEARGYNPTAGPTFVMRAEHEEGRSLIQAMEDSISAADRSRFQTSARSYSRLLRQHIDKEDHCLFPLADQALDNTDQAELERRFDQVEHAEIGAGVHERYLELADRLAERCGVRKNGSAVEPTRCGCSGH